MNKHKRSQDNKYKKYKIKKNDRVLVIAGKEKGKVGVVKQMLIEQSKVIIEGLNKVVCFNKETKEGMTSKETGIHISNVSHIDPSTGKPTRVKVVYNGDVKNLVAKKSGTIIR
jgi:large subunit ribosomal protein L24